MLNIKSLKRIANIANLDYLLVARQNGLSKDAGYSKIAWNDLLNILDTAINGNYIEVDISAQELKNSFSSPIEILPALSAGSYYDNVKFSVEFSAGSIGFDTADKSLYIFTSTSYFPLMSMTTDNFFWETNKNLVATQPNGWYNSVVPDVYTPIQSSTTPESIVLGTWGADSTVGNGTMKVKCWYTVRTFG